MDERYYSENAAQTVEKVLVVDDDADSLEMMSTLLNSWGLQVIAATDGEQAVEKFYAERPQVVLLDLRLPKLNGYEVVRQIRQNEVHSPTKVIALTGEGEAAEKTKAAGFDHYLIKPLDFERLRKILDSKSATANPVL
jgi:CheY-like chemotaxis protein